MIFLVCCWGFDYVPAKFGLEILNPMSLLFLKYCVGAVVLLVVKFLILRERTLPQLRDLPVFILCSIFGEILYFFCEYSAMDYIPVSLLTIILGFVPVISVIVERLIYGRRANRIIIIGIAFCILGIIFVIGSDWHVLFEGRSIGYLLAFGAVFFWNAYNFITASERLQKYDSSTLSCTQLICTMCLCAPMALHTMPSFSEFTPVIMGGIAWLGIVDAGIGFLIMVYGLQKLGPTTSALYSDFMPVSSTFFGAVFLHESITALQVVGGIIVVTAGFFVIREKGRMEEQRLAAEGAESQTDNCGKSQANTCGRSQTNTCGKDDESLQ